MGQTGKHLGAAQNLFTRRVRRSITKARKGERSEDIVLIMADK
jgi:hypothetical protein